MWWRRNRCEPIPTRFEQLAVYNAEKYRGVTHTQEWQAKMAKLQEEYDVLISMRRVNHA